MIGALCKSPTGSAQWPMPSRRASTTVLVARAQAQSRHALASSLRRDGFRVVEAEGAAELNAWRDLLEAAGFPKAVIVSDVALFDVSGPQKAGAPCRSEMSPPVILITPRGDWKAFEEAENAGAAYVFEATEIDDDELCLAVFSLVTNK